MDPTIRGKLERWMRQQALILDEDRGRCLKFVLRHVASGRLASELGTIKVPRKGIDEAWWSDTVANLENQISDDAEGLGGVQTYVVLPYFENNPDKPGSRFTVRETSVGVDDPEDVESEPPTKTGVLTQMMRHTEAATRMSLMSANQVMIVMRNTIGRQAETIEKLLRERQDGFETMERLKSQDLERRLLIEHEEKDNKFKQDLLDKIGPLLPVVVNRLMGRNLLPEKQTAMEGMIKGLVESIGPEQVEKLQAVLTPAQMVSLMEIFQALQPPEKSGNGAAQKQ